MRSERCRSGGIYWLTRLRLAFAILLSALALGPGVSRADQTPSVAISAYDPPAFLNELNRLKQEVENRRGSAKQLQNLRESLPASWRVENAGRRYDVPSRILADQLRRD